MFAVNRYQPEKARRQPAQSRAARPTHIAPTDVSDGRDKQHLDNDNGEEKQSASVQQQQQQQQQPQQQQEEEDETITVISQRKARKLKKREQERTAQQNNEEGEEDDEQRQNERREAKRAKRTARRAPDQQQTEETEERKERESDTQPVEQPNQPTSLVDLRSLLAIKNSTKARQDKPKEAVTTPTTAAVIKQTQAGAVIASADEASKGQRKKDPTVRAAEREARKRARQLEERRKRGEVIDELEEAAIMQLANTTTTPASNSTAALLTHSEQTPPTLSAEEELVREQKRLAARPHWMMRGIHIDPSSSCPTHSLPLHPALLSTLQQNGITDFFPVQSTVLPFLLSPSASDVAVSAPTGSGKTLVYLLPLLHQLAEYRVRRLRALVLVPSRDLAVQVASEAREYGKGVGVKVGVSVGGGGWKREQAELVRRKDSRWSELIDYSTLTPLTSPDAYLFPSSTAASSVSSVDEYDSLVDLLVTTPGRLIDHLNSTTGFTLAHLQWLVIDEVDRLLTQNYNDWAKRIHTALTPTTPQPAALYSDPAARCQKLLFSATLTGDPSSLAALHLQRPVLFIDSQSRQKRYTMPEGLRGSFYLCEAADKPLLLLYVLSRITLVGAGKAASTVSGVRDRGEQVLIFTSSIESCHRVARLLQLWGYTASSAEYSSSLTQHQRTQLLSAFRARHLSILVTSDLMSRGLDITGVTTVVNYDPPLHIQTHVHRAGRTARAGQSGSVVTLCKRREYSWFIGVVRRAANSMMDREVVDRQWMKGQEDKYGRVMERLREVVEEEKRGRLDRLAKLSSGWTDESQDGQSVQPAVKVSKQGDKQQRNKASTQKVASKQNSKQHKTPATVVETRDVEKEGVDESEWSFALSTQKR